MYAIRILTVGKTKEPWLKAAIEEYTARLRGSVEIFWFFAKKDTHLERLAMNEKNLICMESEGVLSTSGEFSKILMETLEFHGSKISFVIGGAEGIPESVKKNRLKISLSKMTFTHQMTRLILLEQIYRALEITKGSGYHK